MSARAPRAHTATPHRARSRRGYLIGFALSVVLTAVPFWLVMTGVLADARLTGASDHRPRAGADRRPHGLLPPRQHAQRGRLDAAGADVHGVIVAIIVIGGSLWIMYHLNANMMPMGPAECRGM